MLKRYQIELIELGRPVRYWGEVWAADALAAIDSVAINPKPYQQWVARRY